MRWLEAASISDTNLKKRLFICGIHFSDDCFKETGYLKINSIPSKLLDWKSTETTTLSTIEEETEHEISSIDNICRSPSPHIDPATIIHTYSKSSKQIQEDYSFEELDELSKFVPRPPQQ